jgi:hypothetical protein
LYSHGTLYYTLVLISTKKGIKIKIKITVGDSCIMITFIDISSYFNYTMNNVSFKEDIKFVDYAL